MSKMDSRLEIDIEIGYQEKEVYRYEITVRELKEQLDFVKYDLKENEEKLKFLKKDLKELYKKRERMFK